MNNKKYYFESLKIPQNSCKNIEVASVVTMKILEDCPLYRLSELKTIVDGSEHFLAMFKNNKLNICEDMIQVFNFFQVEVILQHC